MKAPDRAVVDKVLMDSITETRISVWHGTASAYF